MRKWLIGLGCVVNILGADITEIREIDAVLPHCRHENVWAIFDIDLVLIHSTESAFQMANLKRHHEAVGEVLREMPRDAWDMFFGLMSIHSGSELVDPQVHSTLQALAGSGVPMMALTSSVTGVGGGYADLADRKLAELKAHQLDFVSTAPHRDLLVLDQLPAYRGGHSLYRDGVLFANGPECGKGEVLVSFLRATGHAPAKVVFVDDRHDNLTDVESALAEHFPDTQFVGLHYTAAVHRPTEEISAEQFATRWRQLAARLD